MKSIRYEDPLPISRAEIETALRSVDNHAKALALIRMGLHEKDWDWAGVCLTALSDSSGQENWGQTGRFLIIRYECAHPRF